MRKFFAVAMGSMVALAGVRGAANASATVDLVWIDVSTTIHQWGCDLPETRQAELPGIGGRLGLSTTVP